MKIKDIVNRDIVNLTNCEHEPIHIPGSIQPHGFLIAFSKENLIIDYCSGNIKQFIGYSVEQVIAKPLEAVFGEINQKKVKEYLSKLTPSFSSPLGLQVNNSPFSIFIHESGNQIIAEFEPATAEVIATEVYYHQTRQFVSYMEQSNSLQSLCQVIAEETRLITGYDRVMVYRFDKDYNGEVFAESKRVDIEPFLGIHYPHTDIPAQARELYKNNLLRLIVDVNYVPVPIYTLDDTPGKNLDLGNSLLRSVSPIHVQYLHNIGVGATLTISLMLDQNLWGLIACHHYSPKYINGFTRIAAQLQGHFLTSQIKVREVAEQHEQSKQVTVSLERMLQKTKLPHRDALSGIVTDPEILRLCKATGVAVICEGKIFTGGRTPSEKFIEDLVLALHTNSVPAQIVSDKLVDLYPQAVEFADVAAGVIYYPFTSHDEDGIIWFRGETIREVNWGGDPSKAIIKDEKGLSPRKSFELWREDVKFQSNDWLEAEQFAASAFAQSLERHLHLLFIIEEETKFRILSEKLKRTNDELENVNWIGTHDLKEPLRKIQVFASRILSRDEKRVPEDIIKIISKMNASANRMQNLVGDILSYSKLMMDNSQPQTVRMIDAVRSVMKEFEDEVGQKNGRVQLEDLPDIEGVPFLIHQLFTNLFSNSLKFSRENVPVIITINSSIKKDILREGMKQDFYCVVFKDNGIGFLDEFKEIIFNIFTRLHTQTQYQGSGIGLAMCRKIMENHGGFMTANGQIEEGAEFKLYFPIKGKSQSFLISK